MLIIIIGNVLGSEKFNEEDVRTSNGLQIPHILNDNGDYTLKWITLSRGGHREITEKKLLIASLDVTSSKRFFKVRLLRIFLSNYCSCRQTNLFGLKSFIHQFMCLLC